MGLSFRYNTFLKAEPPPQGMGLRLGIWQGSGTAATPQSVEENLARLEEVAGLAAAQQVQLLAFPELYLSGYIVTPELARQLSEPVDGPSLQRVARAARSNRLAIACPYPERARVGAEDRYYDAIALFDAEGNLLRNYRKTHLWGPDEKRCWSPGYELPEEGPPFTVHAVNGIAVGLLNCYEAEFPELSRRVALNGAKVILIPTAADAFAILSTGERTDRPYPDVSRTLIVSNAIQNNCFVAYANRCGEETVNGTVMAGYLGNSIVAGPHGDILVAARPEATLLIADCCPSDYDPLHPANTDYFADRRPELY